MPSALSSSPLTPKQGPRPVVKSESPQTPSNDTRSICTLGRFVRPPTSIEPATSIEPLLWEVRRAPTESPGPEDSLFHTSFTDIGKKLKACNDTLGELQQLGVSHDVQLPELVLVGDQSAGKSSLMSGLANLDLPRSEGTCTRCPLHIRVSQHPHRSCIVRLRRTYSYEPPDHQIDEKDVTDADPFFPWKKRDVAEVHEFKTMHNMSEMSEIEEVLRWAQVAILRDDGHHDLFVPGSGSIALNTPINIAAAQATAKFSPNVVALEIKGPDLPDLSFYDMPGIFQNPADARDAYLVNVVRNLSREYILHPSAIIICAMPMNSDAENSSTSSLTRKLHATERTLGVLTKADLLPHGQYNQWLDIMNGEKHETGLGYFITSRPQDKGLDALRRWEENFFANQFMNMWLDGFHSFKHRCGVESLKACLSERLGEAFARSLPTIKQKVKCHLDTIHQELARLPELPDNVELEVQTRLQNFADMARSSLENFSRKFTGLPNNFKECLLGMKPKIGLKDDSVLPVIELSSDNESVASVATGGSKRRPVNPQTPSKRQRVGAAVHEGIRAQSGRNGLGYVKREGEIAIPQQRQPQAMRRKPFPEPFQEFSHIGSGFRTLKQLREEIEGKSRAGVPSVTPVEVYNDLAMEAVKPVIEPTKVLLEETMRQLSNELQTTLDISLESLKTRSIYREMKEYLKAFLEERQKKTYDALHLQYSRETGQLCTLNKEEHERCALQEKEELEHYRHFLRMEARYGTGPTYQPLEDLTEEKKAQEAKRREVDTLKLGADVFHREIGVAAYVRGYYRLAVLRFADVVTQVILCEMIPAIREQLPDYLEVELGLRGTGVSLDAKSVYERLMAEDGATAAKREILKGESKKFEKALSSIRVLEAGQADELSTSADITD